MSVDQFLANYNLINIERAIFDIKAGLPILIESSPNLYFAADFLTEENFCLMASDYSNVKIIISDDRASYLFNQDFSSSSIAITLIQPNFSDIFKLCLLPEKLNLKDYIWQVADDCCLSLSQLLKKNQILPAFLSLKIDQAEKYKFLSTITIDEIRNYIKQHNIKFQQVSSTKLKLKLASNVEIISFRASDAEHYAIVINGINNKSIPIVRIHSSCFTGDILNSLACDCGEQLQSSIDFINKNGEGIIIYLQQEGRSIGLINKIRAYNLQQQGFDTVEANNILGFADDERSYESAAHILKSLNVTKIKLLSNNPRKFTALKNFAIDIIETIPHQAKITEDNHAYLATKAVKLGHKLKL